MNKKRVAIIGAGIIGLSTAYYLQKTGCQVVLIDKQEPGTGTSRGHASMIANYGVPGINQPQVWGQLPRYLFSKSSPIAIQWSKIGKLTPWLIQFLKNSGKFTQGQTTSSQSSSSITIDEAYKLLGLTKGCSKEEILQASMKLQKKIHPDVSPETARLSAIVNEAKEVILRSLS